MKRLAVLSAAVAMATGSVMFMLHGGSVVTASQAGQIEAVAPGSNLQRLAQAAVGADHVKAAEAIAALRANGYAGLDALLSLNLSTPEFKRAVDHVAMQKDASVSRLFWHTDIGAAVAEATHSGKPILSLRMLGKLNDDLSCANSRFFRTTLYANATIRQHLRENFVLHWESVRPVPVVTIDMGDGRKIVRTITGNSIHYVLDSRGRVVDGIPGLYGPKAFLEQLQIAETQAAAVSDLGDKDFVKSSQAFHAQQVERMRTNWQKDLERVAAAPAPVTKTPAAPVDAETASRFGPYLKRKGEAAIVRQMGEGPAKKAPPKAVEAGRLANAKYAAFEGWALEQWQFPAVGQEGDGTPWEQIAALHAEDARLDKESLELVRGKAPAAAKATPAADDAARVAVSKDVVENPMLRMVRNLQNSIAMDTVKNEYRLHPRIATWLGEAKKPMDLKVFNERVYAQLFLTPSSDPWLGLAPADVFSALDNGGVCAPETTLGSR